MENFSKYPKIYRIGHENVGDLTTEGRIYLEEKIDGANFRFMFKDGTIILGSRTQQLTSDAGEDTNIAENFKKCVEYIRQTVPQEAVKKYEGYIFYGECCIKHSMQYDWDSMPLFLGFDVFSLETNKFEVPGFRDKLFNCLGLDVVPLLGYIEASAFTPPTDADVPVSAYAIKSGDKTTRKAEGVVYKNYDTQVFAKYVRDAFKELNAKAFGGNPKYNNEDNNNGDFIYKYCTNNLIEKTVFKLISDGHKLHMSLMAFLPRAVYNDIWDENWQEIRDSNWSLDFKGLRKKIPRRCSAVLNNIITNNQR